MLPGLQILTATCDDDDATVRVQTNCATSWQLELHHDEWEKAFTFVAVEPKVELRIPGAGALRSLRVRGRPLGGAWSQKTKVVPAAQAAAEDELAALRTRVEALRSENTELKDAKRGAEAAQAAAERRGSMLLEEKRDLELRVEALQGEREVLQARLDAAQIRVDAAQTRADAAQTRASAAEEALTRRPAEHALSRSESAEAAEQALAHRAEQALQARAQRRRTTVHEVHARPPVGDVGVVPAQQRPHAPEALQAQWSGATATATGNGRAAGAVLRAPLAHDVQDALQRRPVLLEAAAGLAVRQGRTRTVFLGPLPVQLRRQVLLGQTCPSKT